ncbi:Imm52 family immunity protein [Ectopseudomonas guguanensis]|uniref:Imm52 family immunity protein n=1 Tax=Ectopseudomonas guguanensis TaxID=1198456 RepID=UPI0039C4D715
MVEFKSFVFFLRFDKKRIVSVSRYEQVGRSVEFLQKLGGISPVMSNWYLQARSFKDALSKNVVLAPDFLRKKVEDSFDPGFPDLLEYSVWNGEEDLLKGGVAFHYSAHNMNSVSAMRFEDAGALLAASPNARSIFVEIIKLAVNTWPEIDWVSIAPAAYYQSGKVFKDRQTIGWIGYCPQELTKEMLPEAEDLISIPERGTIVVTCPGVMDEKDKEHYERVGDIDTKLVELGYLPMFNS